MYGRPDRYGAPAQMLDLDAIADHVADGSVDGENYGFIGLVAGWLLGEALDKKTGGKLTEMRTDVSKRLRRGVKAVSEDPKKAKKPVKARKPVPGGGKGLSSTDDDLASLEEGLDTSTLDDLSALSESIDGSTVDDQIEELSESMGARYGAVVWRMRFEEPSMVRFNDYAPSSRSEKISDRVLMDLEPDLPTPLDDLVDEGVEEGVKEFFGAMPFRRMR